MSSRVTEILDFWFGPLNARGMAAPDRDQLWFQKSPALDKEIKQHFGAAVQAALDGQLDSWAEDDKGLVALILLLDQFTRNIHRDTPDMFSGDAKALALSKSAVEAGRDTALPPIHRLFLYLPFEHAEDLEAQNTSVALVQRLLADSAPEDHDRVATYLRYAEAHRAAIKRFDRFPHRNPLLGRQTTPAEQAHLSEHGGF